MLSALVGDRGEIGEGDRSVPGADRISAIGPGKSAPAGKETCNLSFARVSIVQREPKENEAIGGREKLRTVLRALLAGGVRLSALGVGRWRWWRTGLRHEHCVVVPLEEFLGRPIDR
jgi:hypothetical protein